MRKFQEMFRTGSMKATMAAAALVGPVAAFADGEGDAAVSQITTAATTVGTIGAAVLTVYVSIKVFKLIRAAL